MATDVLPPQPETRPLPRLQNGDRMTRAEFLRRYEQMPENENIELVEGVVYFMASPVSAEGHGEPHFDFIGWMYFYRAVTPGLRGGDNTTIRLDRDNCLQPDAYLRIPEEFGGQSRGVDGYIEGAPELVAEITGSTASNDLHDKMDAYRRNGVREYIVWRTWEAEIDWFMLHDDRYVRLEPENGIFKSRVFPGLWLDAKAAIAGDATKVIEVLKQGTATPEHNEFATTLKTPR